MVAWHSFNINYIVILSTAVSIIDIIANGMTILFYTSLTEVRVEKVCSNCPSVLLIQELKIAGHIAQIINNALFIVAVKKVNGKYIIVTMIANIALSVLRNVLNWVSIFTISTLPTWMQIEIHPLSILSIHYFTSAFSFAIVYWLLGFCAKNKLIRGRDRILKLKVRIFLNLQIVFISMHVISLIWDRTNRFTNDRIRDKVASTDPYYFATSAFNIFLGVLATSWYFYDVILGIRKDSHERLRRYYHMTLITSPFYNPLYALLFLQEKRIFDTEFNEALLKFLIASLLGVYTLWMYMCIFLYSQFLKNRHELREDGFRINGKNGRFDISTIAPNGLRVDSKTPIGSGHSSIVYRGLLQSSRVFWRNKKERVVAIKVVVDNQTDSGMASVLAEELRNLSRVMKHPELHPNLVIFYGACFLNPDSIIRPLGAVNIVMELCENGSLDSYLLKMNDALNVRTERGTNLSEQYTIQFFSWAEQIAKGMEFLSGQNIIHGDLAARNILLDDTLTAKISDFGMSRKLYSYQIYISTQQAVFPWRWMAPESLDGLKFSTPSDVWSYGVLLWELFSIGGQPWSEKTWSSDFVTWLTSGNRLPKPILASDHLYNEIMLQCWKTEMDERPTFSVILERLANILIDGSQLHR